MHLRLATPNDFEVYKLLYDKFEYSLLYQLEESDIKPQNNNDESRKLEFDSETLKQIEEELAPTREKFESRIGNLAEYRIYIIEEDSEIIGFAELFKIVRTRWKLAELSVNKVASLEMIRAIADMLIKQSRIKIIDVCVPMYRSCEKRMEESGFAPIGGGFYRKEEKQKG